MTKNELKSIIGECVQEIITEMQYPKAGPEIRDEPVGPDNPMVSSDEKIKRRLEAAKIYSQLKKFLDSIHAEPSVIKQLNDLRKSTDFEIERHEYPKDNDNIPTKLSAELNESSKSKLKELIFESIEEIKYEEENCLAGDMEELDKAVKSHSKDCCVEKDDKGNYNINGVPPHSFSIRPKNSGVYDVVYFKDNTDRTKILNLDIKKVKEFVNEKLKSKTLNYVKTAYNKNAENDKDKVEKSNNPRHNIVTKKEIKDVKNDEKNYNEAQVKNEADLPINNPYKEVGKLKRQNENPIKGTKPDYTYPKQKNKDITIKSKKTTKFKK
jgi:hypothetical protein